MVHKEIVQCDVCGTQLTKMPLLEIIIDKLDAIDLKLKFREIRPVWKRRRLLVCIDICSKECLINFLDNLHFKE